MPDEYVITEAWDMSCYYMDKAFEALTQKSVVWLIIQGVLLALSPWDKNSRLFVILAAVGIYSVYGSLAVWISIKRQRLAVERRIETKYRQYILAANLRHKKPLYKEILFIPEINKEDSFIKLYAQDRHTQIKSERNYIYG